MATESAFDRILRTLDDADAGVQTKTASAAEPSTEARMLEAVRRVAESSSKVAAAPAAAGNSPSADLQRMAKEAQASEQEALTKQAHFMGAALADGFMERFAQYDVALSNAGVKTAAVNQDTIKEAAAIGYQAAVADMEKTAAAEYERGYNDQLAHIHKVASDIHYGGQAMAASVVEQLAKR